MSQEYTEDKEVTLSKLSSGRRLLEALLIVIALFAVWLMAALLSFNPQIPAGRKPHGMSLSIIWVAFPAPGLQTRSSSFSV